MQKNLKYFFVHYLQKQFYPLNSRHLGKLQQHPPGTPSPRMPRGYSFTHRWTSSVPVSVIPVKSVPFGTLRRIMRFPFSLLPRSNALCGWR